MALVSNTINKTNYRIILLDELRGLAICLMIAFHFCYDLNYFGYTHFAILTDPFWTISRTFIVSLFVFISGISYSLTTESINHFYQRIIRLGLSALIISIVSHFLFGSRFIYFGVIHFFLAATILTKPLKPYKKSLIIVGITILLISQTIQLSFMNSRYVNWIGLTTIKPATEDYAPLFPWLGLFFIGTSINLVLFKERLIRGCQLKPLSIMGQHSLIIYLLHQPLLFLIFTLINHH